jgi:hypothetical protein
MAFGAIFASAPAMADWQGTDGLLSLHSESFVSPDYAATSTRTYEFIGAGIRTSGLGPGNRFENLESGLQVDLDGQFSPQVSSMSYLNIRQLYFQEGNLSVGRKLENWSLLDENWHLGMYQPQFRWNELDPSSQGLTGVFLHLRGKIADTKTPWGLILFGTPVFIPDQGPSYNLKDGKFKAENPWFNTPPSNAIYGDDTRDSLKYDIKTPDTSRVVFNPGYAAQAYIGLPNDGWSFQAGGAYKPMNVLALPLRAHAESQKEDIAIELSPTFQYHRMFSADLQYGYDGWEAGIGALDEKVEDPKVDGDTWSYRTYGESLLISPFVGARIGWVKLRVMTLSVKEDSEGAKGPQSDDVAAALPHRYPFRDAGAAEASTRFYWHRYEGISGRVRYTQGAHDEFALLQGSLNYQLDRAWTLWTQGALVRANADRTILYSGYDDYDSIQAGVQYVF